ncbi:replication initiation factor domain-containing protein [Ligilactobacillus salivarius]|uniref:Replication initiation factor domain-containing protein n=1 Tax=Ligilactobacillus salivarius TaxID=1624 RepID=A0AAW7NAE4_9LACO|nr:replication initiation factor domain-containing protein [Ligilactobacillus salivarius]MDN4834504.1 replication initiation factor domain-containing protein [Ligilactobacillus salivarius]
MPVTSTIKQTLQTSIDWLEFTIFQLSYEDVIERILQLKIEDFADLSKGKFGYNAQTKWGNGNLFVLFNQVDDEPCINHMGVHVILSGTGCRAYESQKSLYTLINVLVALENQAKLSRIDLAIDDFKDELIKFSRIRKAALRSEFTSRWNKWDELNSRSTGDGKLLGQTMYFGSQTSDIFCRIYDKALEQKCKVKYNTLYFIFIKCVLCEAVGSADQNHKTFKTFLFFTRKKKQKNLPSATSAKGGFALVLV